MLSVATMRVAPAHADQPRAGRQHEAARAIDAGREDQRQPRAGEAVDRALQRLGLVFAAVEAHAEVDGIDAEPGHRHGAGSRGGGAAIASVAVKAPVAAVAPRK